MNIRNNKISLSELFASNLSERRATMMEPSQPISHSQMSFSQSDSLDSQGTSSSSQLFQHPSQNFVNLMPPPTQTRPMLSYPSESLNYRPSTPFKEDSLRSQQFSKTGNPSQLALYKARMKDMKDREVEDVFQQNIKDISSQIQDMCSFVQNLNEKIIQNNEYFINLFSQKVEKIVNQKFTELTSHLDENLETKKKEGDLDKKVQKIISMLEKQQSLVKEVEKVVKNEVKKKKDYDEKNGEKLLNNYKLHTEKRFEDFSNELKNILENFNQVNSQNLLKFFQQNKSFMRKNIEREAKETQTVDNLKTNKKKSRKKNNRQKSLKRNDEGEEAKEENASRMITLKYGNKMSSPMTLKSSPPFSYSRHKATLFSSKENNKDNSNIISFSSCSSSFDSFSKPPSERENSSNVNSISNQNNFFFKQTSTSPQQVNYFSKHMNNNSNNNSNFNHKINLNTRNSCFKNDDQQPSIITDKNYINNNNCFNYQNNEKNSLKKISSFDNSSIVPPDFLTNQQNSSSSGNFEESVSFNEVDTSDKFKQNDFLNILTMKSNSVFKNRAMDMLMISQQHSTDQRINNKNLFYLQPFLSKQTSKNTRKEKKNFSRSKSLYTERSKYPNENIYKKNYDNLNKRRVANRLVSQSPEKNKQNFYEKENKEEIIISKKDEVPNRSYSIVTRSVSYFKNRRIRNTRTRPSNVDFREVLTDGEVEEEEDKAYKKDKDYEYNEEDEIEEDEEEENTLEEDSDKENMDPFFKKRKRGFHPRRSSKFGMIKKKNKPVVLQERIQGSDPKSDSIKAVSTLFNVLDIF